MLLTKDYSRVAAWNKYTGWITPEGEFLETIGYQHHDATLRFHGIKIDEGDVLNHGYVWMNQEYTKPDEIAVMVKRSDFLLAKERIEKLTRDDDGVESVSFELADDTGKLVDSVSMQFDYTHTNLLRRRF